ncbi:CD4-1 molecule isoform 1-T2 [Odontesthes bonariensis]|uniref:CD4-1 molecule n=1 Tax=Odontesthes bonariensis TaxID=219752 RepID=UPI003F581CD3
MIVCEYITKLKKETTRNMTTMKSLIQTILFVVTVLKTTTGSEEVIYVQVGQDVTLAGPASAPELYVYWYFETTDGIVLAWVNHLGGRNINSNDPWKDKLSLSGNSLVIKNIQENNYGTILCNAKNKVEKITSTYKLIKVNVSVSPAMLLLPEVDVSLTCNVETPQGQKTPTIQWKTPQGKMETAINGKFMKKAESQDSGTWTCVVTIDQKEQSFPIVVKVVGLSPAPRRQYTSTSSSLNIPCSFPSDIPWEQIKQDIKDVQWHFIAKKSSSQNPQKLVSFSPGDSSSWKKDQDRELKHTENQKGDFSLFRNKGKADDGGEYQCTVTFKNGKTVTSLIEVDVLQIIPSPGAVLVSGHQLNLTCNTSQQLPEDLKVRWMPPNQFSSNVDKGSSHLYIPNVGTKASGMWRCELLLGNKRLTIADITLKIEPILSVWMLVIICSAAVILVLLCVLTFILCRRRQRKTRHLRQRLCRCKNPKPKGFYRT